MHSHVSAAAGVALLMASSAAAHMILASPVPFGNPDNSPLDSSGANFPCKLTGSPATFYSTTGAASANNTIAIGETKQVSFTGSAVHGGGSCQLAITNDLQPSPSTSWQVILSIEGGCPSTTGNGASTYDYTIPASVAPGKYVFAWTWISKLSGAPEYYMNCAPLTVTGTAAAKRGDAVHAAPDVPGLTSRAAAALPNLFVANLASINSCKTTTSTDVLFPDPGPNVSKPSQMTTNFQAPSGSNCFPLGNAGSSSSNAGASGSSGTGSGSSDASKSAAPASAQTSTTSSSKSATTSTSSSSTTSATTTSIAAAPSAYNATIAMSGATSHASTATASSAKASTVAQASTAAPAATGTGSSTGSSGGLTGSCTSEGMFNCVGGTQYQQCASGAWTALRPLAAGTACKVGQTMTLWARHSSGPAWRRRRSVRRRTE